VSGQIIFEGQDLLLNSEREMQKKIRGKEISMIFQEPMTSLNPVFTVGYQITEAITLHQSMKRKEAKEKTIQMLELVGIPAPVRRFNEYPHQFSGGMRQRVMIAMALACNPKLLIADEPTTALDVTIQAQILELIQRLRQELETTIILITHDLGVIAHMVDEVVVMYCGKIVERAGVEELFANPEHPYTYGLMGAIPKLTEEKERLRVIAGTVPNLYGLSPGCRFHPRCEWAGDKCIQQEPEEKEVQIGHWVSCWKRGS
jgi:oligopeptide/dipeptide ABC transporter ATP-binding protein